MSHPAATVGLDAAGIGSSIWSSPTTKTEQMQPLQQTKNAAPAVYVPPHLRPVSLDAHTVHSKPAAFVPPHLRGFNTPLKENSTSNRPVPPHLQVKFVQSVKVEEPQGPSQHAQSTQIIPPSDEKPAVHPAQVSFTPVPAEQQFVEMIMNQKAEAEAKRNAPAEKAHLNQHQVQPAQAQPILTDIQQLQSGVAPTMAQHPRSNFRPTEQSVQPNATPSVDAHVEPGLESRRSSESFDYQISDTGVGDRPKENIRATQGQDAQKELQDWNGTMLPPPVDWENERAAFDNSFMRGYIKGDWEPKVPRGPSVAVETTAKAFQLAVPIGFDTAFISTPEQLPTFPDYFNSDNEKRQRLQTSEGAALVAAKRVKKKNLNSKEMVEAHEAHSLALASKVQEPHPYAPAIEMYLRPAAQTDLKGIAAIYNHYTLSSHSIVTEDQVAIIQEDVAFLINHTKAEKLPIIVAVRGRMPSPPKPKPQNRAQQNGKSTLPQFEGIIGFGYAETYCYGIGGGRGGRSRFTNNIHFYVHPDYTGKKVGRSILDCLIKSLSHGYGAKDGYGWLNPTDDPVYNPGGVHKCHQIIIQFAVRPNDDPNYKRFKEFLSRYYFDEEGRVRRIARSSTKGPDSPGFVDIIFFAKEASAATEFSPIT